MSNQTTLDPIASAALGERILREGHGPGAWHGADLKAALSDVTARDAYWRPGKGRHNIAEIAMHHAWCVRSVLTKFAGSAREFPLEGEDWFPLDDERRISWTAIVALVADLQQQLVAAVSAAAGPRTSTLSDTERLDLELGITCHAVYHAGQVQLIKVLRGV